MYRLESAYQVTRETTKSFELRPDYTGRLSGGYDHVLLSDGWVEFKTNKTQTDGSVVVDISFCPAWYNDCINAEPDYAADDGGSTDDGDAWCEGHCQASCGVLCRRAADEELRGISARYLHEMSDGELVNSERDQNTCLTICDLISAGGKAATANIKSLVVAAGAAIAKAACYATCAYYS